MFENEPEIIPVADSVTLACAAAPVFPSVFSVRWWHLCCLMLLCGVVDGVCAAPEVVLVQGPAWLERGGVRQALRPGMRLQNRDRLWSGDAARVQVRLFDAGLLKLGEQATVALNALETEGAAFRGALDVTRGVVRVLVPQTPQADAAINVRFGDATVLLRGEADLSVTASESGPQGNALLLRQGSVRVFSSGGQLVTVSQPFQWLSFPLRGEAAPRLEDRSLAADWGRATETLPWVPRHVLGGAYHLWIARVSEGAAHQYRALLEEAGVSPVVLRVPRTEPEQFELSVRDLASVQEAQALAQSMSRRLALPEPYVLRRQ